MRIVALFRQLRDRRVIRAAVIYLAVLWAALQAADLFAGAEIISEGTVRWMILVGAAGFPVVVLASWFLENPWKDRRWTAIAGDVVVAVMHGDRTLKRLKKLDGRFWLVPEAEGYPHLEVDEYTEIWGVVVGLVRRYRR